MTTMQIVDLPIKQVWADANFNCRGKIQPIDVIDLAKDIDDKGLIQAVTVAPLTVDELLTSPPDARYRLIAGYRRHTAHRVLKKTTIPCVVREDMQDAEAARLFNLSENLHRKELDILQEKEALRHLKDLGMSEAKVAVKLGVSRGWVQVRFMMLVLPEEVCLEIAAYKLTNKQVRNLYSIYGAAGVDSCINAVKKMKDAKINKGRTISLNPNLKDKTKARVRTRSDVLEMLDHVMQSGLGPGVWTRCLAWCAGNINDLDLHRTFINYSDIHIVNYRLPDDVDLEDLPEDE